MNLSGNRRPRLALPFTVLAQPDQVRLVAGEDFRYTLSGPKLDQWLPDFLRHLDGRRTVAELVGQLAEDQRAAAQAIISRLYGERVLIDGLPEDRHEATTFHAIVVGTGALAESLAATLPKQGEGAEVRIFCQDKLDYEAALRVNRAAQTRWLWASTGPMSRAYVSTLFLPDAGPCLECLVRQFHQLSPAPAIYDELRDHAARGEPIPPTPFPAEAVALLRDLVIGKLSWLRLPTPPAVLYRLHVLELATLEVTTHRVFPDPRCPACAARN